jgi:hypothetical protein
MTRSPRPDTLQAELAHYQWLKAKLLEDYDDLDRETLADTLEGATSLVEVLSAVVRHQLDNQTLATALKIRIEEMRARQSRLETRVKRARELVSVAMEQAGLSKITEPDFTLSLRPGVRPLMIIDEEAIPDLYWELQPAKLKRQDLRSALGDGKNIPGAVLGNAQPTVSIRTR